MNILDIRAGDIIGIGKALFSVTRCSVPADEVTMFSDASKLYITLQVSDLNAMGAIHTKIGATPSMGGTVGNGAPATPYPYAKTLDPACGITLPPGTAINQPAFGDYDHLSEWAAIPMPSPAKEPKCECGASKVGSNKHSDYCALKHLETA